MTDHIERMKVEAELLDEKIGKLMAFTESKKFLELDSIEQDLMIAQSSAMATYLGVLKIRYCVTKSKQSALSNL